MATPCDIVMFVQLKQLMIVGIDCYHDTAAGKRSIGALVASLNQSMSRLVSITELGIHTGSSAMLSVMFNMCKQGLTWRFVCVCVVSQPLNAIVQLMIQMFFKVVLKVCAAAQRSGDHG